MDKLALIRCFQDTLNLCESNKLKNLTKKAKKKTIVYDENVLADKYLRILKDESEVIEVIEGTSFATAKK